MPRGRPPKRLAIEREPFVPPSANAERPLLRLRAAEITTEGSTCLHTSYIEGTLLKNLPTDNTYFIDDDVGYAVDLDTVTEDILGDAPLGKRKRTAAVSVLISFV
jgi:hypothetical protein